MSTAGEHFEYRVLRDGRVQVTHNGRLAATLRGAAAADFLHRAQTGDPQSLMARVTGNYKRGNEKVARNHPRNRER